MTDNARELVSDAEALLQAPAGTAGPLSPGVRARAAAMLLRLALDQRLDDFWHGVAPAMTRNAKHRMLCLEAYTTGGPPGAGASPGPRSAASATTACPNCLPCPPRSRRVCWR